MKRLLFAVLVFGSVAHAQIACNSATSPSGLMRAEGTTEQTADLTITCAQLPNTPAIAANAGNSFMNVVVGVSPSLTITSKGSLGSVVEATAVTSAGAVQGSVTGAGQVSFASVPVPKAAAGFPACVGNAGCNPFTVTITNIRVNVSILGTGPTALTETALTTSSGFPAIIAPTLTLPVTVGIATNGMTAATIAAGSAATGLTVCGGVSPATPAFILNFGENFSTSFKLRGTVAGNAVLGAWQGTMLNTETGYIVGANLANSATRIRIDFSGLPAATDLYVPLVMTTNSGGGTMTLVTSETGAFSAATATTDVLPPAGTGKLTITAGSGSAVYEITAQASGVTTVDQYSVPVYVGLAPFTTPAGGGVSATVQYAAGLPGNIPGFAATAAASTPLPGVLITACTTTSLFPYITNGGGFDTGLAIANVARPTTVVPLALQSGTCSLGFFGNAAPKSITTVSIPAGTDYLTTLSTVAPNFTGYMIARCNFLAGYGFAYISHDLVQGDGVSMGYLSLVINRR